ncbi:NAD(P)-dependent oxidoreductase [Streptomyces sp. CB03238]|uniref:NAD(P)-dependent oxidoreductase n=1 Tax=Streptomyces sp. CB03238 TaxID=1907777 RepID=UPI000A0F7044|nr:NAD(P)-dependent oxidoreductase [Streptomyces sp. CB03238]ORT59186.1 phosphogluconate dehydrogenase [Streptomyces sp. CB03238]
MTSPRMTVGLLHPGSMGAAVGGQLRRQGTDVLWCPTGRSRATAQRAVDADLAAVDDLGELLERADLVLSLCPPGAAESVAEMVAEYGFADKIYVEANAITPQRVGWISQILPDTVVIDAAVIGSPPVGGKQPRLYVAGAADPVALLEKLFAGTDVRVRSLGTELGRASALKLTYSSYQKASRVLAALSYGLAEAYGVGEELLDVASQRSRSYLVETDYIPKTAARAWRWGPEMEEAAALLADAGLPDDLMHAVVAVLALWDEARGADLTVEDALALLQSEGDRGL